MNTYYMNAPCKIVRKISDIHSEVIIYPQFRDDVEGKYFCTQCMVGDNGTPTKHTCVEYDEVISALEDIENSIVCIVENRLIASEPIEFKEIRFLKEQISKEHQKFLNAQNTVLHKIEELRKTEKQITDNEIILNNQKNFINQNNLTIEQQNKTICENQKKISVSLPKELNITSSDYQYLAKRDFILTKLEIGGVDNWEWYGESYPTDEELKEFENNN